MEGMPAPPFGRPLAAFRVAVVTEDAAVVTLVCGALAPLGVAPAWPAGTARWDLLLATEDARACPGAVVLTRAPGEAGICLPIAGWPEWAFASALRERVLCAWRLACAEEERRWLEGRLIDAQRQRDAAVAHSDRAELLLLASYEDLRDKHAALRRYNDDLERANGLLAQVVHDLRADLFNISLASEFARQAPEEQQTWEVIARSLARIDRFLKEKLEVLREGPSAAAASLDAGLEAALQVLAGQLAHRRQVIAHELAPQGTWVALSQTELEQVLINLIGNASKFSPDQSTIRCVAAASEQEVVVQVIDQGGGLPPALLADPTRGLRGDPAVPGSGQGLGIVRSLVTAAGGRLCWKNGEQGAHFSVHLPRVPARSVV